MLDSVRNMESRVKQGDRDYAPHFSNRDERDSFLPETPIAIDRMRGKGLNNYFKPQTTEDEELDLVHLGDRSNLTNPPS
jgi:hypothetical protein